MHRRKLAGALPRILRHQRIELGARRRVGLRSHALFQILDLGRHAAEVVPVERHLERRAEHVRWHDGGRRTEANVAAERTCPSGQLVESVLHHETFTSTELFLEVPAGIEPAMVLLQSTAL